jgi:hypothetical protein
MSLSLDQIATAADERKREQQRQAVAQMATEIERIKAEDWKAPEGVDAIPTIETPAPADWFIRGEIAKAKRDPSA